MVPLDSSIAAYESIFHVARIMAKMYEVSLFCFNQSVQARKVTNPAKRTGGGVNTPADAFS